ncbi:LysR family transcriptional regulator [Goekera deserti]|uniref:LysR family transcriptional regulator n=1 Tax=Goekera deserti TaxID=2497753 RepID=A0A7K3WFH7_9ACTN|nr:LysR family transcriptional regulator [Goekera deserti]NDI46902.1 LysR family transcriptional regulator [Goekera deserti]NEL54470.1 LysR family transcriptional regulator [Goekera deserti]
MPDRASTGPAAGGPVPEPSRRALRSQDLMTLPVLRALLVERSVTRAGESVGLSQPATSAVLAQLRRRFGDELLVRVGRDYQLTPLAASLQSRLEVATDALDRLFGDDFEPATTSRRFTLAISDYLVTVLAEQLSRILADEAPGASLDVQQLTAMAQLDVDALLRQTDGAVLPHELVQGHPGQPLLADRWVCIVSTNNTSVGDELSLDELAALPWVSQLSRHERTTEIPPLRRLGALGIDPHVDVLTDSFLAVPFLVAGSNRVAFVQERLARRLAPVVPVRIVACPVDVVMTLSLRWHQTMTDDPGHRWLRGALVRAARLATADDPAG